MHKTALYAYRSKNVLRLNMHWQHHSVPKEDQGISASSKIRPQLRDPDTWYRINYAWTQITQWDVQNKGKSGWTGKSSLVLEVPLRYLRPTIIYSVPCDRIVQRTYLVILRCRFAEDGKDNIFYCTKIHNACAKPWFCSLTFFLHRVMLSWLSLPWFAKIPSIYSRPCCFAIRTHFVWMDYTYCKSVQLSSVVLSFIIVVT